MAAVPILHGPSAVMNELPTHMAFALTVAGGAYEPEGQSFSNEMLVEKRVFLVRGASTLSLSLLNVSNRR